MNKQEEARRIAKDFAHDRGGKPSQYMKKAMAIVNEPDFEPYYPDKRKKKETKENTTTKKQERPKANTRLEWGQAQREEERRERKEKGVLRGMAKQAAINAGKSIFVKPAKGGKSSKLKSDLNFMKAPKDRPDDVFGGLGGMLTKSPQKVKVPDGVSKYLKDTFRFK